MSLVEPLYELPKIAAGGSLRSLGLGPALRYLPLLLQVRCAPLLPVRETRESPPPLVQPTYYAGLL